MQPGERILVTGAGGFIGRDLVTHLIAGGFSVRAMLRPGSESPFDADRRIEMARADMRDAGALEAAVRDCHAVVHLAAAKSDEPDSDAINIGGARLLMSACERTGCRRVVNISTQSTKITRKGIYARTKLAADEIFMTSSLDVTSLLPSIVYGESALGVFGTVLRFVQMAPVVPVLGDGQWVSSPVYVGDVSEAVVSCLRSPSTIGRTYDIGGPDSINFDDLIDRLAAAVGRRPRKVHVPFAVALAIARVVSRLPRPPITVSNVLGSNQDTRIDIGPARRDFGFDPIGLAPGLAKVIASPPAGMRQR